MENFIIYLFYVLVVLYCIFAYTISIPVILEIIKEEGWNNLPFRMKITVIFRMILAPIDILCLKLFNEWIFHPKSIFFILLFITLINLFRKFIII